MGQGEYGESLIASYANPVWFHFGKDDEIILEIILGPFPVKGPFLWHFVIWFDGQGEPNWKTML